MKAAPTTLSPTRSTVRIDPGARATIEQAAATLFEQCRRLPPKAALDVLDDLVGAIEVEEREHRRRRC